MSDKPHPKKEAPKSSCSCVKNPYTDLPPELRPKNRDWKTGLRQVTCPGCGLDYWTNAVSDLCIDCQKKGVRI